MPAPPIRLIRQFNPLEHYRAAQVPPPEYERWPASWQEIEDAKDSVPALRALNMRWFKSEMSLRSWAAAVWRINEHLTRLGIGPAWRGLPLYFRNKGADISASSHASDRVWRPSRGTQRNNMLRWIDLHWLRAELGPGHKVHWHTWRHAFDENYAVAESVWARINSMRVPTDGRVRADSPFEVLRNLAIPELHRVALTGLVDTNTAKRRRVAHRRLADEWTPKIAASIDHASAPSSQPDVETRLQYCEAIELGQGSPTDAATIYRWMTGTPVTRQTVHEMKTKLSKQYGVRRKYWLPVSEARTRAKPGPSREGGGSTTTTTKGSLIIPSGDDG